MYYIYVFRPRAQCNTPVNPWVPRTRGSATHIAQAHSVRGKAVRPSTDNEFRFQFRKLLPLFPAFVLLIPNAEPSPVSMIEVADRLHSTYSVVAEIIRQRTTCFCLGFDNLHPCCCWSAVSRQIKLAVAKHGSGHQFLPVAIKIKHLICGNVKATKLCGCKRQDHERLSDESIGNVEMI